MHIVVAHFNSWWVGSVGGVEKVVCQFANAMIRKGHKVTILYIGDEEGETFFPLDDKVETINVLFENGVRVVHKKPSPCFRIYRELYRLFSMKKVREVNAKYKGQMYGPQIKKYLAQCKPDVVVACSGQSVKYTITDGECQIPVVYMIHSDCTQVMPNLSKSELAAIEQCRVVQVLIEDYIDACKKYISHPRFVSIGNAIEKTDISAYNSTSGKKMHKIVCVASFGGRKNQVLLADAFAKIADKHKDWCVEFWGGYNSLNGQRIKKHIENLHCQMQVMGTTNKINDVYAGADIFCLPAISEGFPLALGEAMAAGLPCVGLKRCTAVNYLIDQCQAGYLTDDTPEDLAKALEKLMQDASLREQFGKNAKQAIAAYEPEKIWEQWDSLLQSVVSNTFHENK